MRKFTYQTNLYSTLQNLIFQLEQWQVEVESTERKVKRLKSEAIFLVFLDLETENDRCAWRWNEVNKCFQTLFRDWKPLIDSGKVICQVYNWQNADKLMRKLEEMDRRWSKSKDLWWKYNPMMLHNQNISSRAVYFTRTWCLAFNTKNEQKREETHW